MSGCEGSDLDACLSSIVVALVLAVSSAGLIAWHVRAWRRLSLAELDAREQNFRRRQYRRRVQTSAMLGVLGGAILVGQLLIAWPASESVLVPYWCGVFLLVLWLALLALADMAATRLYYGRERDKYVVEQARLQGQLRQVHEQGRAKNNFDKS